MRVGLLLAVHQGWSVVDIESDCATLIAALSSEMGNYSEISGVVSDCSMYRGKIHSIHTRHVYQEANECANRLARVACSSIIDVLWLEETPAIIRDVVRGLDSF
jgi:hypothetical protein